MDSILEVVVPVYQKLSFDRRVTTVAQALLLLTYAGPEEAGVGNTLETAVPPAQNHASAAVVADNTLEIAVPHVQSHEVVAGSILETAVPLVQDHAPAAAAGGNAPAADAAVVEYNHTPEPLPQTNAVVPAASQPSDLSPPPSLYLYLDPNIADLQARLHRFGTHHLHHFVVAVVVAVRRCLVVERA